VTWVAKTALLGIAASVAVPMQVGAAQPAAARCVVAQYQVVAVPIQPAGINDAGQVVGTTATHRAALWTAGADVHEIPLPAGFYNSEAIAINNRGHILGVAYDRLLSKHQAFIFANGAVTLLGGEQTRASRINESDQMVGESLVPGTKTTQPVLWTKNAQRPLGSCCGGSAISINNHGEAIGNAYDDQGRYHAFLWTQASGIQLIGPPDRFSSAVAGNDLGHVVVTAFPDVFLYSAGTLGRLDLSHKYPSHPHAINDCDTIVGSYGAYFDADRAFVWSKTLGFQDLNSLIPADSHWKLESAASINGRGEIVGRGDSKGKDNGGFLLIPKS
jgi:probable HAF family extracellular repeat protein